MCRWRYKWITCKCVKQGRRRISGTCKSGGGYGAHMDIMKDYQLIILAPQVASNYEDIKQDTDRLGIKLAKTQGVEYINLTRDGKALDFVQQQFEK